MPATSLKSARARLFIWYRLLPSEKMKKLVAAGIHYSDRKWEPDPKFVSKFKASDLKGPNIGKKTINDIKIWLKSYGLKLKDDPSERRCPHCGQKIWRPAGNAIPKSQRV